MEITAFQPSLAARFARMSFGPSPVRAPVSAADSTSRQRLALRRLLSDLSLAQGSLETLNRPLAGRSVGAGQNGLPAAQLHSLAPLGLDLSERATTLESSEEINTVATSYTPFGPTFSGSSTSLPTISGVYTGNQDDVYTFTATSPGLVGGPLPISIEVRNGQDQVIDQIDLAPFTPADTPFATVHGLTLTLSAGAVRRNDSFQVAVYASQGSAIDPDKPFDGVRNENPNLEPGHAVQDGSFDLNGVSIAVQASDTLNDVIDRINQAGASVAATFDAATETVKLERTQIGFPDIVLANDTSGFLAATKLEGATSVRGRRSDLERRIFQVAPLQGVSSGTFAINGQSFALDVNNESLQQVLDRVNQSSAGVVATFDEGSQQVSVKSQSRTRDLVLDDGDTGLFSALGLELFQAGGEVGRPAAVPAALRTPGFGSDTGAAMKGLGRLFASAVAEDLGALGETLLNKLQKRVQTAFDEFFRGTGRPASGFGIHFTFHEGGASVEFDEDEFREAVSNSPQKLARLLAGRTSPDQQSGLVPALLAVIEEAEENLVAGDSEVGRLLDVTG